MDYQRLLLGVFVFIISLFLIFLAGAIKLYSDLTGSFVFFGSIVGTVIGFMLAVAAWGGLVKIAVLAPPVTEEKKDEEAAEDMENIKGVLEFYGRKKRIDPRAIQAGIIEYARDLVENHSAYVQKLGSLGYYLRDIVTSSNPKAHGHFNPKRGEGYVIGLFRELGLYKLLKGKV